ncbi:MAG: class I SAM-dependent methyltransferase [Trebonia sp.]
MTQLPDFDAVYEGAPMLPGSATAPWNIGGPQPVLAGLLDEMRSPVLDAGCGIGETSLALAALGRHVAGIDLSPAAIDQARASARQRGLTAEFEVADVRDFHGRDGYFATVVDSSLFHSVPVGGRQDYLRCIARAARPGARLYVSVFDAAAPFPRAVRPNAVSEAELRGAVGAYWHVDSVEPAGIRARVPATVDDGVQVDELGFAVYPSFLLRAHLPD